MTMLCYILIEAAKGIYCCHSIESPSMVDPQWHTCIWYWGSKWNLHTVCWGAVGYEWSGAQPLFTVGLLMFALSLVDFLSLLLSPSINIKTFNFCQKYHLKNTYKICKKFHAGLKFEWGLWDLCWLSCERLPYEVFTRGQFWPSGIVIACVCVCVRVCVSVCVSITCLSARLLGTRSS